MCLLAQRTAWIIPGPELQSLTTQGLPTGGPLPSPAPSLAGPHPRLVPPGNLLIHQISAKHLSCLVELCPPSRQCQTPCFLSSLYPNLLCMGLIMVILLLTWDSQPCVHIMIIQGVFEKYRPWT